MKELPDLKLPHAHFHTLVEMGPESSWNSQGIDRIEFQVAMNKGQELCALTKAASGGELARLMLALKAVLAAKSDISTIIFDEIDIGVGGAVAAAIGKRLQALSKHVQVVAITHSPQVAASASHHYFVSKNEHNSEMRTNVVLLEKSTRQEELARMLSGSEITMEARAAASSLLNQ
jgi:DNA repair protein RecN (Recombination protein N)